MLDKIDLNKKLSGKEYKEQMEALQPELSYLQRAAKELQIPVIILVEGLGAAGKGTLINHLIEPMDPRGFTVYASAKETEDEKMHPFLWRYWSKTPERGRIAVFDRGWYKRVLTDRFDDDTKSQELERVYQEIVSFEENLAADGTILIKLFLHISKKEQKVRLETLEKSKETRWRVTKGDLKRNKEYDQYLRMNEEMLEKTDQKCAPWHIIEGTSREYAAVKAMQIIAAALKNRILSMRQVSVKQPDAEGVTEPAKCVDMNSENGQETIHVSKSMNTSVLAGVDLNRQLSKEEYKKQLEELQLRLARLHNQIYQNRIPVVLAFEGWDAGGKGGAIKRLTQALDPRGYVVNPVASPNDIEKAHHYLWRFWTKFPKDGHIAIFDRSWYGRVMVERIEGFCSEEEWSRAYREINQMEEQLTRNGTIVLKFWMHIDKDEQARRFKERQENPAKQWKITDEDWRNREKWDAYEEAVDEMLVRTSTLQAPWIIVEGNDKYYARIKVLKTVVDAIETKLKEREQQK